jgi:hypothetical protein
MKQSDEKNRIVVGDVVIVDGDRNYPCKVKEVGGDKALCVWGCNGVILSHWYELDRLIRTCDLPK